MQDRTLLRIGAVSLIAGVVLTIIGGALHPTVADPGNVEAVLQSIADSTIWAIIHVLILAGGLLSVGGLLAVVGITTISYGLSSRLSSLTVVGAEERTSIRYAYAYIPIVLAGHLGTAIQHLATHGVRATKVAIN